MRQAPRPAGSPRQASGKGYNQKMGAVGLW